MQISPGTTRFFPSIYLPHLPPLVPCSYGTSTWMAALSPTIASYAVPVRQARGLPPTSFRFRLATNTLVFGYVFPATGQTPIFHRLETCAAGRTMQKPRPRQTGLSHTKKACRPVHRRMQRKAASPLGAQHSGARDSVGLLALLPSLLSLPGCPVT